MRIHMRADYDQQLCDEGETRTIGELFARIEQRAAVRRWWKAHGVDVAAFTPPIDLVPATGATVGAVLAFPEDFLDERGPNGDFIIGTLK